MRRTACEPHTKDESRCHGAPGWREDPDEIYLRQFFVVRTRRRHGIGRNAMQSLLSDIWPGTKCRTVAVLVHNTSGVAFWRAIGYQDYALTLEIMPGAPPLA